MYSQLDTLEEMGWNRLFAILINEAISPPSAMASYPYKLYIIISKKYFVCTFNVQMYESLQFCTWIILQLVHRPHSLLVQPGPDILV